MSVSPPVRWPAALAGAGRALGRRRAWLFPIFAAQFVLLDVVLRRGRAISAWSSFEVALAAVHSALLWLALGVAAGGKRWAGVVLAVVAGATVAFQSIFFARFARFADRYVAESALSSWSEIGRAHV